MKPVSAAEADDGSIHSQFMAKFATKIGDKRTAKSATKTQRENVEVAAMYDVVAVCQSRPKVAPVKTDDYLSFKDRQAVVNKE